MAEKIMGNTVDTVGQAWRYIADFGQRNMSDYYQSCESLRQERMWKYFFFSSLLTPFVLYLILAIWTFIKWIIMRSKRMVVGSDNDKIAHVLPEYLFGKPRSTSAVAMSLPWSHRLQLEANKIVCCQNLVGEIIAVTAFILAMVSFGIYVYEVSDFVPDLEICRPWIVSLEWQIDFACNMFFLFYFLLRLLASNRKVLFLTGMYTIVDYCTIPPAFVCLLFDRNWSGLRFLRILHIFSIPEVLQYVGFLTSRNGFRLSQLVCQLAGVVLVGAGFFHLFENFFAVIETGHSYGKFLYFTIITISTVGYGDIYPQTAYGRVFGCLFIMAALGLFASSIPDIANMMTARYKYGGTFELERGSHHIIVCGHITHAVASQILENCFHNDQEVKNLSVVFISREGPDLEMEAILRKNFTQVSYLQGDVLNSDDLARAAVKEAFACLIIADKRPERVDSEDALNIMRVISIKNVQPTTRVIVQLLHRHHQTHLFNLPTWSVFRGDTVINLSQLKMGMLAASCQAMGFSSLMANLLRCYPVSQHRQGHAKDIRCCPGSRCFPVQDKEIDQDNNILDTYKAGFKAKIRIQRFSDFYTGMNFHEAARHCFTKLNLLLIGLFERPTFESDTIAEGGEFIINPTGYLKLTPEHLGVFVAQDQSTVDRVWFFCKDCHAGVQSASDVKFCGCENRAMENALSAEVDPVRKFWLTSQYDGGKGQTSTTIVLEIGKKTKHSIMNRRSIPFMDVSVGDLRFSNIGVYHQVPKRTFAEACIEDLSADYRGGLANHIVVCVLSDADAPTLCLHEFIAPLRAATTPYTNLRDIILFGNTDFIKGEWEALAEFPKIHVIKGSAVEWKNLELVSLRTCSVCVVVSSQNLPTYPNEVADDQQAILATLNLKSAQHGFALSTLNHLKNSPNFHTLTTLAHDENIRFLEQENLAGASVTSLSKQYMAGEVLVDSVLDLMTISTYFNPLAIPLIQSFMYGRSKIFQSDGPPHAGRSAESYQSLSALTLMEVGKGVFSAVTGGTYGDVLLLALDHGMISLGIFRLLPDLATTSPESSKPNSNNRYILTAPPPDFPVQADDLLFIFSSRDVNYRRPSDRVKPDGTGDGFRKVSGSQLEKLMVDMKEDLLKHQAGLLAQEAANQRFMQLQSPYHHAK